MDLGVFGKGEKGRPGLRDKASLLMEEAPVVDDDAGLGAEMEEGLDLGQMQMEAFEEHVPDGHGPTPGLRVQGSPGGVVHLEEGGREGGRGWG